MGNESLCEGFAYSEHLGRCALYVDSQQLYEDRMPEKAGWEIHPASNADPNDTDWSFVDYAITRSSGDAGWVCHRKGEYCGTLSTTVAPTPPPPTTTTTTTAEPLPQDCNVVPFEEQHTCLMNRIIECEGEIADLESDIEAQEASANQYQQCYNRVSTRWNAHQG